MTGRIDALRRLARNLGLDAVLVTSPTNLRHLTGYSADDDALDELTAVLLVDRDSAHLLTSPNNLEWARAEVVPGVAASAWRRPWTRHVAEIVAEWRWSRLGFEDGGMLVRIHRSLAAEIPSGTEMVEMGGTVDELRARKSDAEIDLMQASISLTDEVFVEARSRVRVGMTERELARIIEDSMRAKGADGPGFPTIVASGPNAARPHHATGSRAFVPGEPIIIDMGARLDGYHADLTRTITVGAASERLAQVYNVVRDAQSAALSVVRAGAEVRSVDQAYRDSVAEAGFESAVVHAVGHGLGMRIHEHPSVSIASDGRMEAGHVVTIEPGLYVPGWGGVRIEDVVLVTDGGHRQLSAAPKEHFIA